MLLPDFLDLDKNSDGVLVANPRQRYENEDYTTGYCRTNAEVYVNPNNGTINVCLGNQSRKFDSNFRIPSRVLAQMLAAQLAWEAK